MSDKIISILGFYYEEWKFRQENLWKRIIQFFIIIFFVSTFPITIGILNGISIPKIPLVVFPIIGIILSLFFLLFCLSESSRINSIDYKIKLIIQNEFPNYAKNNLIPFNKKYIGKKDACFIFRWKMAIWVPIALSSMQIVLAIFIILLILSNSL